MKVSRIEVSFPIAVEVTDAFIQELLLLISTGPCTDFERLHRECGAKMWPSTVGAKMLRHPLALEDGESIPFDEDVLHIGVSYREDGPP